MRCEDKLAGVWVKKLSRSWEGAIGSLAVPPPGQAGMGKHVAVITKAVIQIEKWQPREEATRIAGGEMERTRSFGSFLVLLYERVLKPVLCIPSYMSHICLLGKLEISVSCSPEHPFEPLRCHPS